MKEIIEGSIEGQGHFELEEIQQQLIDQEIDLLGGEDILLHGEEYKEQIVETYDKKVRQFRPDLKTATHLSTMKSYNTSWGTFVDTYLEPPYLEAISDREQIESIADYMVSVEEIRFDNWKDLSLEQQVDVLNKMERCIANIEHRPAGIISTKDLDAKTYGYQLGDSIVINSKYLNVSASSPEMLEQMLDTLIHEGRHRYQYYNVDERLVHDSLAEVESWRENFYKLGYNDGSPIYLIEFGPVGLFTNDRLSNLGERLYYYQPIEIDAREFASDVLHEYHKLMSVDGYVSPLLEHYVQFDVNIKNTEYEPEFSISDGADVQNEKLETVISDIVEINHNEISFKSKTPPNHNSDGYIYQAGEKFNGFQVYKKGGHTYYWNHLKDQWIEIEKDELVKIKGK